MNHCWYSVFLFGYFAVLPCLGDKLTLATAENIEPYVIFQHNNAVTGIDVEIMRGILENVGITDLAIIPLPRGRAERLILSGEIDGFLTALPFIEHKDANLWYSDVIYNASLSLITKATSNIVVRDFMKGSNLLLGGVRGSPTSYFIPNKVLVGTDDILYSLLNMGRIDGAVAEELSFFSLVHKCSYVDQFKIAENIALKPVRFAISTQSPHYRIIINNFNLQLAEFKSSEKIEELFIQFLDF
ncbi:substrate-binding periplasmic protein [Planctobacterium marinum]|uniref:substrate-binding periplasmic protein n=1 Tax=Planctobacterium marinum TaxID=1631968 RepID=UPI001E64FC50|nr:transporter substrate-binding domain-containing protein [Planctobacterium marinum]MCC2604705.1 transporter substrate-binding domain-containing protein [Planctobacterium marinum]